MYVYRALEDEMSSTPKRIVVTVQRSLPLWVITAPNVDRFPDYFTGRLISKFAVKSSLTIPPHLKRVATLPCETLISEN